MAYRPISEIMLEAHQKFSKTFISAGFDQPNEAELCGKLLDAIKEHFGGSENASGPQMLASFRALWTVALATMNEFEKCINDSGGIPQEVLDEIADIDAQMAADAGSKGQ